MLVRMLTDRAGITFSQRDGVEYDLPEREAMNLIKAGQAEAVEMEAAVDEPARETTALRTSKHNHRKGRGR